MANDIPETIAAEVRAGRARAGFSRKRLAAQAGVSERYLAALEQGEANVSIGVLAKVAGALSLDVAGLLARTGPGPAPDAAPPGLDPRLAGLLAGMSPLEQRDAASLLERHLAERRRSRRGIALLGLRGAGKSTLAALLSARRGIPAVSITREIERRVGMSLADLFNLGGAEGYRALENEVVSDLAGRDGPIVVETAGGIVGNPRALDMILGAFTTVWLRASPEEHIARVIGQGDTRPMHGNPRALDHVAALLAERETDYGRAELVLDTTGRTPEACADEIERMAWSGEVAPISAGESGG